MTMPKEAFVKALTSLWLRLSTVAIVALLFLVMLRLPARLSGTSFYLSTAEALFEIVVDVVLAALAAVALGAVCAAAVAPFLLFRPASRRRIVDFATRAAVAVALFLDLTIGLNLLHNFNSAIQVAAIFASLALSVIAVSHLLEKPMIDLGARVAARIEVRAEREAAPI